MKIQSPNTLRAKSKKNSSALYKQNGWKRRISKKITGMNSIGEETKLKNQKISGQTNTLH